MKYGPGIESNWVKVGNINTHYLQAGSGEPLILVHGAGPGASGWSGWRQTIPELSKHFRVYAIDTLGFGLTEKPTDIRYTDQASVDHLAGFMDALCLEEVRLCGNSRGAYIAAKCMLDHPGRVKALLMISSGSIANAMGLERRPDQEGGMKALHAFDGTPEGMRRFLQVIVNDHSKITDELIAERVSMAALPGHDFAQKSQREFRTKLKSDPNERQRFDIRHRLPMATVPMIMVWGAKDTFAPPEFSDRLQEMLPNVEFVVLEHSGHQAQNDEHERFNEIAIEFFQKAGTKMKDRANAAVE